MNVFVLCTGRCGSLTFSRACGHLTNYTSGHETKAQLIGPERFDYSENHIEVDNRLSWFLGGLAAHYDGKPVTYVHLRRDAEAVAQSFLKRWNTPWRASIIHAFGHGLVQRSKDWPDYRHLELCRSYVDAVTANIEEFLRGRPSMTIWLEEPKKDFQTFLDWIDAEGDLQAAQAEFLTHHNASDAGPVVPVEFGAG